MSEVKLMEGKVVFSNVQAQDVYNKKEVGYNLTLALDEADADILEAGGVVVKEYEGTKQRKFKTFSKPKVVNVDNDVYSKEIPYGSLVRVAYVFGERNADHGVPVYINGIRVVDEAEGALPEEF